ncbi:hypothetical protein V1520DRAFT_210788 [Lipomyces starkeyi]
MRDLRAWLYNYRNCRECLEVVLNDADEQSQLSQMQGRDICFKPTLTTLTNVQTCRELCAPIKPHQEVVPPRPGLSCWRAGQRRDLPMESTCIKRWRGNARAYFLLLRRSSLAQSAGGPISVQALESSQCSDASCCIFDISYRIRAERIAVQPAKIDSYCSAVATDRISIQPCRRSALRSLYLQSGVASELEEGEKKQQLENRGQCAVNPTVVSLFSLAWSCA